MAKLYFTSQLTFIHIFRLTTTLVSASILSLLAAALASLHFLALPPPPQHYHIERGLFLDLKSVHSFLVKLQQLRSAVRLKLKSLRGLCYLSHLSRDTTSSGKPSLTHSTRPLVAL